MFCEVRRWWHILAHQDQFCRHDVGDTRPEFRRRAVIYRNDDYSGQDASPERDDPFRAILRPEHHFVAFDDTDFMEAVGEDPRRATDLVICVTSAPKAIVINEKVAAGAGQILEEVD